MAVDASHLEQIRPPEWEALGERLQDAADQLPAIKTSNAQIRAMDKATSKIEAAEKALGMSLAQSASTCGF